MGGSGRWLELGLEVGFEPGSEVGTESGMKVWFKAWASEFSLGQGRKGVAVYPGIELGLELGDGVGMYLLDLECQQRWV